MGIHQAALWYLSQYLHLIPCVLPTPTTGYRMSLGLLDLLLIDINVGSSGYPTGQQGSYSNCPPASRTFTNVLTKDSPWGAGSPCIGSRFPPKWGSFLVFLCELICHLHFWQERRRGKATMVSVCLEWPLETKVSLNEAKIFVFHRISIPPLKRSRLEHCI